MRNKKSIDEAVEKVLTDYQAKFGGDGFVKKDVEALVKRTKSRIKVDWLDKQMDSLVLSFEEIEAWEKELDKQNLELAEKLFEEYVEQKNIAMALYQIDNYRTSWSREKRLEMVKKVGASYTICPFTNVVSTVHAVKKEAKQRKQTIDPSTL